MLEKAIEAVQEKASDEIDNVIYAMGKINTKTRNRDEAYEQLVYARQCERDIASVIACLQDLDQLYVLTAKTAEDA